MLNIRALPPRALRCFRTPLSPTVFRNRPHLRLGTHAPGCRRIERRCTSTSTAAYLITPSQPPPKSWVERVPEKIRPYLYLARVDKPIGTLLLYYPCSASPSPRSEPGIVMDSVEGRLVDNDGLVRAASPHNHTFDIPDSLWNWRVCHARGGMYDQ